MFDNLPDDLEIQDVYDTLNGVATMKLEDCLAKVEEDFGLEE